MRGGILFFILTCPLPDRYLQTGIKKPDYRESVMHNYQTPHPDKMNMNAPGLIQDSAEGLLALVHGSVRHTP